MANSQIAGATASLLKSSNDDKKSEGLPDPLFGHVYSIRKGIESFFGTTSPSPSSSSKASSKASSASSGQHVKPRRFLVWKKRDEAVEVLAMSSFNSTHPNNCPELFPHLPRDIFMKKLLALKPENASEGDLFPGNNLTSLSIDTYLILKPITVPLKQRWKKLNIGPFNKEQLAHVNQKIKALAMENFAKDMRDFDKQNQAINDLQYISVNDDHQQDDSSSSSSISIVRSYSFLDNSSNRLDKKDFINKWLKDVLSDDHDPRKVQNNDSTLSFDMNGIKNNGEIDECLQMVLVDRDAQLYNGAICQSTCESLVFLNLDEKKSSDKNTIERIN